MSVTIKRIYANIKTHMAILEQLVENKNPDDITGIAKHQKQAFIDAKTSIINTLNEISEIEKNNALLYEFACTPENF